MNYFKVVFLVETLFVRFLSLIFLICLVLNVNFVFGKAYFICSRTGIDSNFGTSSRFPWKTLEKIKEITLIGGDTLYFSCGSSFIGGIEIVNSGSSENPIVLTSYGEGKPPKFSNPERVNLDGNAIRLSGSHIIVENFFFHDCAAAGDNDSSYIDVWAVGAIRIMLGANHCVIRNCEFSNCPKSIQSTGEYSLITQNYFHSANKRALSYPGWGPIAIHIGNSNQEISYNVIKDHYFIGGEFGADGGAIEIDDGRNPKKNIYIHHNYSSSNMGFLEVSWFADIAKTETYDLRIAYNVSDDYQQFVMLWAPTHNTFIENNTILRRQQIRNAIVPTVFLSDYGGVKIRNNIIVTDSLTQVYTGINDHFHTHNLYWSSDGSSPNLGAPLNQTEIYNINPKFLEKENDKNYFALMFNSPAIDAGKDLEGKYTKDFLGQPVPSGNGVDIGAFEYQRKIILE